jgi:hypothetical protein
VVPRSSAASGTDRTRNDLVLAAVGAAILAGLVVAGFVLFGTRHVSLTAPVQTISYEVLVANDVGRHVGAERTVDVYRGLGAWVDGFDYSPPYAANNDPPLIPKDVIAMAVAGVDTLYLQSGRLDDRSPGLLEDRWVLTEFLMRADNQDVDVVAWFLPKWGDDGADLAHLQAAADFDVLGYRFDGVAVDIEWNQDGLEVAERNRRFVELSQQFRLYAGTDPVGAIVLPPVQTEVINPAFWPEFPWGEIAPLYDVWLPMSYWSFRTDPYGNGYSYNQESTQRLRANLGDPDALVHAIGGIGAQIAAPPSGTEPYIAQVSQLDGFVQSLIDTGAIGGSVYDWLTTDADGRIALRDEFTTGAASDLGGS